MLTKREIVDLVIENLSGGQPPDYKKWHPRVVRRTIDAVLSQVVAQVVQKDEASGQPSVEATWVKSFDKVKVRWDNNRKQCYSDFPAHIISLKQSRGLREVRWRDESDLSTAFIIIDATAYSVINQLECSNLSDGNYHASPEGDRIYFPDMPFNMAQMNAKVRVKMLCGSDGFSETEVLPLPDEATSLIVQESVKMLTLEAQMKQKMTNDSNPNVT